MKFRGCAIILATLLAAGCADAPGTPPAPDAVGMPTNLLPPGAAAPSGGGPIDANGRAIAGFQGPSFTVAPDLSFSDCLVVYRSGSQFPLSLQTPGAQVAVGGRCPSVYWQATTASAEALGRQGLVQVQGIGACRLPPFIQRRGPAQNCM